MWGNGGQKPRMENFDRSRPGSGRSDDGSGLLRSSPHSHGPTSMSTSSSYNSLSPSSPLGEFPSKPARQQQPLPSPGGGLIPDPHTSPLQNNGTKRTGLKISFSQPNLRKAGQMNLKFPDRKSVV